MFETFMGVKNDVIEITGTNQYGGKYIKLSKKGDSIVSMIFKNKVLLFQEIEDLKRDNTQLKNKADWAIKESVKHLQDISCLERVRNLDIEEAKNKIRKEMRKDLVEADVELARLKGKIEAYEKTLITKGDLIQLFGDALEAVKQKTDIKVLPAR